MPKTIIVSQPAIAQYNRASFDLVFSPQEYAIKYRLSNSRVAKDLCISENSVIRYNMQTHNAIRPSLAIRRITQLLDFIYQLGYEPPNPPETEYQ